MADEKIDRSEMWKAIKWIAIAFIACLIAFGVWKAWSVASAPARIVGDAAGSMKDGVSNVVNRLDVEIENSRRFNRAAETAFSTLNNLEAVEPEGMKDRAFRLANLNGAQDRVCEMSYDFGQGDVPVYLAVDNDAHAAAKAVGSKTDRLIRIVMVSPEQTLGLNAEYDEAAEAWQLSWRPSSLRKPYEDSWAQTSVMSILRSVPKRCG